MVNNNCCLRPTLAAQEIERVVKSAIRRDEQGLECLSQPRRGEGGIGFWKGYNSSARNPPSNGRNSSFIIRLISQRRRERKPKRIKNKLL